MPLQAFLEALALAEVRPAFADADACESFWTELEERSRPELEAYEQAHRESQAVAFREWRN
jgi:hypothetical protein